MSGFLFVYLLIKEYFTMYFKIKNGSTLYDKLVQFTENRGKANRATLDYVKAKYGEDAKPFTRVLAGGLSNVKNVPDELRKCHRIFDGGYVPKVSTKTGKEIQKEWDALPRITSADLAAIVGYKPQHLNLRPQSVYAECPGFVFKIEHGYVLMETSLGSEYTVPEGAEEIPESEYVRLSAPHPNASNEV